MASGHSGAITNQSSTPIAEIPEKKACINDRSCKAALIALGIICMIGGAVAAGVLYSDLGYISLSCLGADLVGIILIALSSRYKRKPLEKNILETLTEQATKDDQAFLIDFSQVKPSNMFDIFKKDWGDDYYGAVTISDAVSHREDDKFTQNFPHRYSIEIHHVKTKKSLSLCYMFTMNDEGRVEFYGKVFGNFDLYLENFIQKSYYDPSGCSIAFEQIDFLSVKDQTLRKKAPAPTSL